MRVLPPSSKHRLCQRCRCEREGCQSLRRNHRWCAKHFVLLKAHQYAVPAGVFNLHKPWSLILKALARLAYVLPFVEPLDLTVLTGLRDALAMPGAPIDAMKCLKLFGAHLIKWPPAVTMWTEYTLSANKPSDLVQCWRRVLVWCSGRKWPVMFERMNSGLMDAQTGLVVNSTRLQLTTPHVDVQEDNPKRRKGKTQSGEHSRDRKLLTLGRELTVTRMLEDDTPAIEIFQHLHDGIIASGLSWPTSPGDVPLFADRLLEVIKSTRAHRTASGACLRGGMASGRTHYNAKHFLRVVLVGIEAVWPGAFDALSMRHITQWLPDQNNHVEEFSSMYLFH